MGLTLKCNECNQELPDVKVDKGVGVRDWALWAALRKRASCIYIAVEESVAADLAGVMLDAASQLEALAARCAELELMSKGVIHGLAEERAALHAKVAALERETAVLRQQIERSECIACRGSDSGMCGEHRAALVRAGGEKPAS